jgi:hypothetical protein
VDLGVVAAAVDLALAIPDQAGEAAAKLGIQQKAFTPLRLAARVREVLDRP